VKEKSNARRNKSRSGLQGDKEKDRRQGEGGADRAGANGAVAGNGKENPTASPERAPGKPSYLTAASVPGLQSEENIRRALVEAKGDLFVAACVIEVPVWMLERMIRSSEALQAFVQTIERIKVDPDFDRWSTEQFTAELHRLTTQFALDGLLVIHKIATDPVDSAADREVQLKAAMALRNASPHAHGGGGVDALLHELNLEYQRAAPRIREIRTTTVVLEDSQRSGSSPLTVEQTPG
jgi:hypothetical protein